MKPERVLITGTTSGLGRALLEHYARRGANVICVNRRRDAELEVRYPTVRFECIDVRSSEHVRLLLRGLTEAGELPELFILNAGINRIDNDEYFELPAYREVIETNLYGALNFVEPLTRLATHEIERHVVAISSMASYIGNPYGLGYSTSKKALTACFETWASMYTGTNLVFQRVMLGPVRTNIFTMAEQLPTWMVWLRDRFSVDLTSAAAAIARLAQTRKKKLIYPRRAFGLYLGMWLGQRFIPGLFRGRKTLAGNTRRAVGG